MECQTKGVDRVRLKQGSGGRPQFRFLLTAIGW